jgi:hypothetical protein
LLLLLARKARCFITGSDLGDYSYGLAVRSRSGFVVETSCLLIHGRDLQNENDRPPAKVTGRTVMVHLLMMSALDDDRLYGTLRSK